MDLLLILLILVGIALGVFLIILVVRTIRTVKHLSQLSIDLHDPLTQTAEQLPSLIRRMDSISTDVAVLTKSVNENVPAILLDTKAITGTARAGVEAVSSAAEDISSDLTSIFSPAQGRPDTISSIIGIVSQVFQIVGVFTRNRKPKQRSRKRRR
ncbi:MAG: hypothetical protein PHP22_09425 [Oscillospiraceae bacterium]|nr:hypothetical protein [Oscillospiraceae bacterium]